MSAALAVKPEVDRRSAHKRRFALSNNVLLSVACGVLLFGPLAFGAVEPWSIFVLQASAALLLAGWAFLQWRAGHIKIEPNRLYAPMLAFMAVVLLQDMAGITAYRHATDSLVLLYLSYGILAFVVTQTLRRSSQLRPLAWVVCGYGAVVAFFALLQGIAPNGQLYWTWPVLHGGAIYGPYVNRNHYAGLMEMLAPFPIVLAASHFTHGNRKIAVAAIGGLMAGTIFLSGSRGGMLAFCLQMVVLILLLRPKQNNWKRPLVLGTFLTVMIGLLVWLGGNELTERLASIHSEAQHEIGGGVRLSIARDSLRMWRARPLFGWGLGTFPEVYPQFRSFYTTFFVNEAHNDYVQLLVETGLAGFGIGIWFLVLVFRNARTKLQNWTETVNGTLTVAAFLGIFGILIHSFLDFNLQIPSNAALFYVLCAIAASESIHESQKQWRRSRHHSLILEPNSERKEL